VQARYLRRTSPVRARYEQAGRQSFGGMSSLRIQAALGRGKPSELCNQRRLSSVSSVEAGQQVALPETDNRTTRSADTNEYEAL